MEFERVKPSGINKDLSPRAVDNQGNRLIVNPCTDRLNSRPFSTETSEIGAEQNIPGTILKSNPHLPGSGTNLNIGSFPDKECGRLIVFNYNSLGSHGVYSWNPIGDAWTVLIQSSILNFSSNPRYRITGIGITQNLLYWTDGLNPSRMINMTRNYAGITDEAVINLYKRPPVKGPYLSNFITDYYLILDAAYKTSAIAGNIYQFATRYVYADNELSAIGPYSDHINAYPSDTLSKYQYNGMQMYIYVQPELALVISKVQLLYRKNNSSNWYLYSEHAPAAFTSGALLVKFFDDNANTVLPVAEVDKIFDAVPLKSKALATFKGRNFLTADLEDYTVDQSQSYAITGYDGSWPNAVKEGGNYSYGLAYYDKDMRTPGVTFFKKESVAYQVGTTNGIDLTLRRIVRIILGDNTYPSWAKYVAVCRSLEQNYEAYMQIPVRPMFYVGEGDLKDAAGAAIAIPAGMEKYNNGKVYLNQLPNLLAIRFHKIHWQVPENIPLVPDSGYFLRVITPLTGLTKEDTIPVLAFDGQSIITNNIGGLDWSVSGFNSLNPLIVEVFKIKQSPPKFMYELSKLLYELPHPAIPFPNIILPTLTPYDWDTYVNDFSSASTAKFLFKNMKINGVASDACYDFTSTSNLDNRPNIETPSGVFNNVEDSQDTSNKTYASISATGLKSNTPDYSKSPDFPGRRIAYNPNAKQSVRNTTIRFSDPFIQDSNINGLSSFASINDFPLPSYRSPVPKLQPAGNVLLAIHERTSTSLYVGEGFVKDADGTDSLTKTDTVIGQERELSGAYGCYHPESIAEYGSTVFGFDLFKGVIWRYDNNGQVPISDLGMKTYFWNKAIDYLPYKDTVAIVGGIDPYHKEYIIHFPATGPLTAETWAFNFAANQWIGRYSYAPEGLNYINNHLVSFKNGQLWVHNQDKTNYNTFYGVKYPRSVTILVNPFCSRVKRFVSMQISAEQLTEGDSYPVQHFANVAAFPGTGAANVRYHALDVDRYFTWNGASYDNISEVVIVTAANREGQATYMKRKEFDKSEGIFYGSILRDTNTSNALMSPGQLKLRDGKYMLTQVLDITLQNNSKGPARQHYFNAVYVHSMLSI